MAASRGILLAVAYGAWSLSSALAQRGPVVYGSNIAPGTPTIGVGTPSIGVGTPTITVGTTSLGVPAPAPADESTRQ